MGIPTVWEEDKENIFIVWIAVILVTLVIRCLSGGMHAGSCLIWYENGCLVASLLACSYE